VFGVMEQVGASHPDEPHWYLPAIGVDPHAQGRGLGPAVIAAPDPHYRPTEAGVDRRDDMREATVALPDGRRLGYAEHGDPTGIPIVQCHGVPGGRALTFGDDVLAASGARVISVERPGFGLSDPRPGRVLLDVAPDVAALADALGLDRFAVYGASMGAPNALACAYALPDRVTVVGIACGLGPVFDEPRFDPVVPPEWQALLPIARDDLSVARDLVRSFVTPMAEAWAADPDGFLDTFIDDAAELDRAGLVAHREMWAALLDATYRRGPDTATEEIIASVGPWGFAPADVCVPVHLWHGDRDEAAPVAVARFVADQLPDVRLTVYEGEGHYLDESHHVDWLTTLVGGSRRAGSAPA
jgi:pimeloyl-ACP methyl ester carboxylesterase